MFVQIGLRSSKELQKSQSDIDSNVLFLFLPVLEWVGDPMSLLHPLLSLNQAKIKKKQSHLMELISISDLDTGHSFP